MDSLTKLYLLNKNREEKNFGVQITLTKEPSMISNDVMEIVGIDSKGKTYAFCIDKKNYHIGDVIGIYGSIVYGDYFPLKVRKVK